MKQTFRLLAATLVVAFLGTACGFFGGDGAKVEPTTKAQDQQQDEKPVQKENEAKSPEQGGKPEQSKSRQPSQPEPLNVVRTAYRTTSSADTAKVDMTFAASTPRASSATMPRAKFRITARGAVDIADQEAYLNMRIPDVGRFQVRQVGSVFYEKLPKKLSSDMPDSNPWIKMDLETFVNQSSGANYSDLQQGATSDLSDQLKYLREVSQSVERVNTKTIRGVSTTHYKATVSLQKVAATESKSMQRAYKQTQRQTGIKRLPVNVWVDDEGMIRRTRISFPMPYTGPEVSNLPKKYRKDLSSRFTIVQDLYDFGTPVSVSPPPDNLTTDITALATQNL